MRYRIALGIAALAVAVLVGPTPVAARPQPLPDPTPMLSQVSGPIAVLDLPTSITLFEPLELRIDDSLSGRVPIVHQQVQVTAPSGPWVQVAWNLGPGPDAWADLYLDELGDHEVTLTVTDQFGRSDSVATTVTVRLPDLDIDPPHLEDVQR